MIFKRTYFTYRLLAGLSLMLSSFSGACQIGAVADASPKMLPSGYLSTKGSQIVDRHGHAVRIACVGGLGTVIVGGHLYYGRPYEGVDANISAMNKIGFNCIRVDFNDKSVDDPILMGEFDQLVAACTKYGLKVIFDHHNNEATAADWGNAAQQTNGLWFDIGPGTYGTDGTGTKGTVSPEQFQKDWVAMATHWAGNSTVIGFDLDNEPHISWGTPPNGENWGEGGPGDIWAMYTNVGNAIEAADPGALIICEGFMDNTDKSSIICWNMDLTHVAAKPVVLNVANKVVYSVHEYPNVADDVGSISVARMNEDWGYLVKKNIAPVWIGEMGASLDKSDGSVGIAEQKGWGDTIMDYMNGKAPDGPRFTGHQQGISGDWWLWGCRTGETPDGCLDESGTLRAVQAPYIDRLMFRSR